MRTLFGEYTGWAPRFIRVKALANRVRAWLNFHATSFGGPFVPRMTYQIDGDVWRLVKPKLPFGWTARRSFGRDAYDVAPWWWFALLDFRWEVYWFAKYRLDAVEGPEGGEWSEHRWWPDFWRPSDEDCPPEWLATSNRLRARLRELKGET